MNDSLSRRETPFASIFLTLRTSSHLIGEVFHHFVDLPSLVICVTVLDGVGDAGLQVLAKHKALDLPKGSLHGVDLGEDVNTVSVLLDHPLEATHLALNLPEAPD